MTLTALIILYAGLGLAMTLLRLRQGAHPAAALLAGLAWPLEIVAACLVVTCLTGLTCRERETSEASG